MSIDNLSSEESRAEWQQYLDTLPKVPGGNGKKEYVVGCYTPDDWEHIHKVLMEDGTLEDNIPKDGIQCSNSKNHSETRGTYVLDDAEVESLRKHPKVKFVNIDTTAYQGSFAPNPDDLIALDRYSSNVKHHRDHNLANNLTTSINRAGYQVLRGTAKVDPWKSVGSNATIQDKVEYIGDGTDVDVIVGDNAGWYGHPEFNNSTGNGPQLYTGGNVLPGNGTCDVLDVVLDAPYYLDPEWFNTPNSPGQPGYIAIFASLDGSPNKTETRWDGTTVPTEAWAKRWWGYNYCRSHVNAIVVGGTSYTGGYSSTFTDFGSIIVNSSYTRARCNGSNTAYPTASSNHSSQCQGQAYGRTMGWAFNANKWHVDCLATLGIEDYFDIVKVFHLYKPNRSSDNTKNPTVSSNSWGYRHTISNSGTYYFRQGTSGSGGVNYTSSSQSGKPRFLRSIGVPGDLNRCSSEMVSNSMTTAGDEMSNAGVIFVAAAGNSNQKMVNSDHADYNNYVSTTTQGSSTALVNATRSYYGTVLYNTTSRWGFPAQLGKYTDNSTGKIVYPTINVGALDDDHDDSSSYHTATGKERKVNYSVMGEAVDCYTPGDGSLAPDGSGYGQSNSNYARVDTYTGLGLTPWDTNFGGTSSACPTAAGMIATKLQANRTWGWADIKDWIDDKCGSQTTGDFYYGPEPTTATSTDWDDIESLMGGSPKVMWDASTVNQPGQSATGCTDPNATNYNPNATVDDGSCTYAQGSNNLEQKDVLNTVHFPVLSNVKFSQLRNTFRDKNPAGTIRASELRRRTSKTNMDPVVPDSTENTPIATTTNWKVSQFQNSRKYYKIDTSGTSTSTINIGSLAWNSNMNKNIRKWYYIKHDSESLNPNQPAFNINEEIVNFTLDLQADVHGAGGLRGGEVPSSSSFNWPNSTTHGGPGGDAVQMTGTANSNNFGIWLRSSSELFAGGGGGGRGGGGVVGPDGPCWLPRVTVGNFSNGWGEWYSYSRGGGCQCEWYIGCGNYLDYNSSLTINDSGGYLHGDVFNTRTHDSNGDGIGDALQIGSGSYRSHRSNGGCNCWGWGNVCHNTCIAEAYCAIDDPQQKPGAPGGSGGYGGLGQGGNQNRETNGQNGNAGTPKNCPTYATVGNTGGTGGSGGDWAQPGTAGGNDIIPTNSYGRPTGPGPQGGGPGGVAGRSVRGSGYVVAGSTGNVKGTY